MRAWGLPLLFVLLTACQSVYYSAAEKVGIHKRDILVDRVEDSRDAQQQAGEQFESALAQFSAVTNFDGGDLEAMYKDMEAEYEDSVAAADKVRERIDAVEHVAEALFDEWGKEIGEYSNSRLRADSERQLRDTRRRYEAMMRNMRSAEARMDPVLAAFKDNVLYLKHNLNARALNSLKIDLQDIEQDVNLLIAEMRQAIASSDAFIEGIQSGQ